MSLFTIILISCNQNVSSPDKETLSNEYFSKTFNVKNLQNSNYNQIEITDALEEAAMALSKAIRNKDMRLKLKEEISKKFDGDFEALYKSIKDHKFSDNSAFSKVFAAGYKENKKSKGTNISDEQAENELSAIIGKIPKFQIAIPVNFDKWDAEKDIPLVTFKPCMKRDLIKQLKSVDKNGNIQWLDAKKAPDVPVIVLGWNERTDENGKLINNIKVPSNHNKVKISNKNRSNENSILDKKRGLLLTNTLVVSGFQIGPSTGGWKPDWFEEWWEGYPEFYIDSYDNNNQIDYHDLFLGRTYFLDCIFQYFSYYFDPAIDLFTIDGPKIITNLHLCEEDGGLLGSDEFCGEITSYFSTIDTWYVFGFQGEYQVAGIIVRWY